MLLCTIWLISNIGLRLSSIPRRRYCRYWRATGYVNYFNRVSDELQECYNYLETINSNKCVKGLHKANFTFLSKIEHAIPKLWFSLTFSVPSTTEQSPGNIFSVFIKESQKKLYLADYWTVYPMCKCKRLCLVVKLLNTDRASCVADSQSDA
jgi:hypothetical protein